MLLTVVSTDTTAIDITTINGYSIKNRSLSHWYILDIVFSKSVNTANQTGDLPFVLFQWNKEVLLWPTEHAQNWISIIELLVTINFDSTTLDCQYFDVKVQLESRQSKLSHSVR